MNRIVNLESSVSSTAEEDVTRREIITVSTLSLIEYMYCIHNILNHIRIIWIRLVKRRKVQLMIVCTQG